MRTLIVFATVEGHTAELARVMAEDLHRAGHQVRLCDVEESHLPKPADFDAALIAGPVHRAAYPGELRRYVRRHHKTLNAMPSAFVSVSLWVTSDHPEDLEALNDCLQQFEHRTRWRPSMVHQAAGAIRYEAYGFLTKLAARLLAAGQGPATDTSENYDLTDYAAVEVFLNKFMASASARAA